MKLARGIRYGTLVVLVAVSVMPAIARAVPYESAILIDEEQDLYELQLTGEISDDTFETLLELYRNPLDLNVATRDDLYLLPDLTYEQIDALLLYRSQVGRIADPAALVVAGILSRETLEQIAPFLLVGTRTVAPAPDRPGAKPRRMSTGFSGTARYSTGYSVGDTLVPPMFLQTRLRAPGNVRVGGAVVLTRRRLGEISYDPLRDALMADRPSEGVQLPKLFALWEGQNVSVIAGTFRLGFGQRLTLDNSSRYTPDGFYPDDVVAYSNDLQRLCRESRGELDESPCGGDLRYQYTSADHRWSDGFRGVAATLKGVSLGGATLKATGFASYQSRSLYQYELYDRGRCDDPRSDDRNCSAPPVYVRTLDGEPAPTFSLMTLPDIYDELAGGGNVSLSFGRRARLGFTGYYAQTIWGVDGIDLDFQEWSRTPFGGPYGAVGADAAWGTGPFDFFLEAARSFDSTPDGGGGFGIVQRSTLSLNRQELELSFRYYDREFANPYARSIASPSQLEGLRTRNEAGARLRYQGRLGSLFRLRGSVDAWMLPEDSAATGTAGMTNLDAAVRADFVGSKLFQPSVWGEYRNKDLAKGGRDQCFQTSQETDEWNVPLPCSGELYRAVARVAVSPLRWLSTAIQYQHTLLDDAKFQDGMRQDSALWFELMMRPIDSLRLRGRARYLLEDISSNDYLEHSLWTYLDATWAATRTLSARARYDYVAYLDERASTLARLPNPEHRFRLELETRF